MVSIFDVEPLPVLLRARPVRFWVSEKLVACLSCAFLAGRLVACLSLNHFEKLEQLIKGVRVCVCLLLQDLLQSCLWGGEEESGGHVL